MINIDGSLFIQIVNFLFLIWVLNIVLYKPIRNILIKRKEKIDGLQQTIDISNKDALERDAAFTQGIREARAKGLKEKDALIAAASEDEKNIIEEINKKAQADLVEVRNKIKRDTEAISTVLQKKVDDFARAIGQKLLGRAVE
jgi:F-type H+-transporting ATPase subunit b